MKLLSRDFNRSEKMILLALVLLLLGLAYYNYVHLVVKRGMEEAIAERDQLQSDLVQLQTQLAELNRMRQELDDLGGKGGLSLMASYNNIKTEMTLLNSILEPTTQYSISFSGVSRSGDLVRRGFSLQYTAPDFSSARRILEQLALSEYRCLLGDISYSRGSAGQISISVSCTFYETMVGGVADAGLPAG